MSTSNSLPVGAPRGISNRVYSRDPEHYRADLADSFEAALGDWASAEQHEQAGAIMASITDSSTAQQALRDVAATFGAQTFGTVLLFHIEARTSLSGPAEALTFPRSLAHAGWTVADLGWPEDTLKAEYADAARSWDPAELERFRSLVARFRARHESADAGDLAALGEALAPQRPSAAE